MIARLGDIIKEAGLKNGTVQIPFRIKNGEFVDKVLFSSLEHLGDTPITVISKSDSKLVLEITAEGARNMTKALEL